MVNLLSEPLLKPAPILLCISGGCPLKGPSLVALSWREVLAVAERLGGRDKSGVSLISLPGAPFLARPMSL